MSERLWSEANVESPKTHRSLVPFSSYKGARCAERAEEVTKVFSPTCFRLDQGLMAMR